MPNDSSLKKDIVILETGRPFRPAMQHVRQTKVCACSASMLVPLLHWHFISSDWSGQNYQYPIFGVMIWIEYNYFFGYSICVTYITIPQQDSIIIYIW